MGISERGDERIVGLSPRAEELLDLGASELSLAAHGKKPDRCNDGCRASPADLGNAACPSETAVYAVIGGVR